MGDGCIWQRMSLMNACCASQSLVNRVVNASDGVFKRKSLMEK